MEDMTMRKMMFAASLLIAACGNVEAIEMNTCATAAECGDGQACDLVAHECVSGNLTLDATGFVVDGERWWTNDGDPTLAGTFEGAPSSTVEVAIGSQILAAVIDGNVWRLKLPADSIASTDTTVTIKLSDPSGGLVELSQTLVRDTNTPSLTLATSRVRDERGDVIDFSTGEPVHTHVGAEVDLATADCPSVYKYAYLMASSAPAFGRQATPNPLAWNFSIAEAKLASLKYRWRTPSGQALIEWQDVAVVPGNNYSIELKHEGPLTTLSGLIYLDVLATDWAGYEGTTTACVDYHPLAAPLQIETVSPAANSVFGWSLPANSPISQVLSSGSAPVAVQRIVQHTTEPVQLSHDVTASATYSKTVVSGYVQTAVTVRGTCYATDCFQPMPAPATATVSSGDVIGATYYAMVVDEATQEVVSVFPTTTIPARAANEAPHSYLLVAYVSQLASLRTSSGFWFGEYTVGGQTYTGTAPGATTARCEEPFETCTVHGVCLEYCNRVITFTPITALDQAHVDFNAVTFNIKTAPFAGAPVTEPSYVSLATLTMARTWDLGDDDLPGAEF